MTSEAEMKRLAEAAVKALDRLNKLPPGYQGVLDEVQGSNSPAAAAVFVVGLMSGIIAEHTGSNDFAALLRMITLIDMGQKDRPDQDREEIKRLTAMLEAKYTSIVEH